MAGRVVEGDMITAGLLTMMRSVEGRHAMAFILQSLDYNIGPIQGDGHGQTVGHALFRKLAATNASLALLLFEEHFLEEHT